MSWKKNLIHVSIAPKGDFSFKFFENLLLISGSTLQVPILSFHDYEVHLDNVSCRSSLYCFKLYQLSTKFYLRRFAYLRSFSLGIHFDAQDIILRRSILNHIWDSFFTLSFL